MPLRTIISALAIALLGLGLHLPAQATTYLVQEIAFQWETIPENRFQADSGRFQYGDDESLVFTLPWGFPFYGSSYTQMVADTNGNIWFDPPDPAALPGAFGLDTAGWPVIAAWNADLSSYHLGGVFIEQKVAPERVVVQWTTETWQDQGKQAPNRFQAVLFPDGTLQLNYQGFSDPSASDRGSGVAAGQAYKFINLSAAAGTIPTLAGRSFRFLVLVDSDGDGLPDVWETENGLNPLDPGDAERDSDADGLDNLEEYQAGTNPGNPDTDQDGLADGWEINFSLNPLDGADGALDSDQDGLTNLQEFQQNSDPWNSDTDGDGIKDGMEKIINILPIINSLLLGE